MSRSKLDMLTRYSNLEDYRPLCERFPERRHEMMEHVSHTLIYTLPFKERFYTDIVPNMLLDALDSGKDRLPVEEAFQYLELYCLNLIHYYYKPEIKRLKRYTGIYRSKLLAVLPETDKFMAMLGYHELVKEDSVLHLSLANSNRAVAVQLALDCLTAQAHCRYVHDVSLHLAQHGGQHGGALVPWGDLAPWIRDLEGPVAECAAYVGEQTAVQNEAWSRSLLQMSEHNMAAHEQDDMYS